MKDQRRTPDKGKAPNRKKASNNRKVTYLLLALAVVLLLGSAVGSTRAALTYQSENYEAEIVVSQIGVSLLENGEEVSRRDYNQDKWEQETNVKDSPAKGALLTNMLEKDKDGNVTEKLVLNKDYPEELAVKNSGSIDEYVRVRIYRSWKDQNGKKVTTLSPDLIHLNLVNTDRWIERENGSEECIELYYKGILPSGSTTELFADTIRIDGSLAEEVEVRENKSTGKITMVYKYDGVQFFVDVDVDAVQTHNAQDAIMSSWGIDAAELGIL